MAEAQLHGQQWNSDESAMRPLAVHVLTSVLSRKRRVRWRRQKYPQRLIVIGEGPTKWPGFFAPNGEPSRTLLDSTEVGCTALNRGRFQKASKIFHKLGDNHDLVTIWPTDIP